MVVIGGMDGSLALLQFRRTEAAIARRAARSLTMSIEDAIIIDIMRIVFVYMTNVIATHVEIILSMYNRRFVDRVTIIQ